MNNKFEPLSRTFYPKNISKERLTKSVNFRKKNMSSLIRRKNNPKPELHSLLNTNYKFVSRGTELPAQYRRLTDDETERLFGFSYRVDFSDIKKNLEKNHMKKKSNLIRSQSDIGERLIIKKNGSDSQKIKLNDNNENEEFKNNSKNGNNDLIINSNSHKDETNSILNIKKNPIKLVKNNSELNILDYNNHQKINLNLNENTKNSRNNKLNRKKDVWRPKGYTSYELLVKNPNLFSKKLKYKYSINKSLSIIAKSIRDKSNKSDIFFFKQPSEKEALYIKNMLLPQNYHTSDIFNIKNDPQNLMKCAEKYLFKKQNLNKNLTKYDITRESNSKWQPAKNNVISINTSSSKDYNIINPLSRNNCLSKDKIMIECEKKKDKNSKMINCNNYLNPLYKKKGLTEFIDITRNGAPNYLKDYNYMYRNDPKCFFKSHEVCNDFSELYFRYKNLCKRPFVKDFFN